MGSVTDFKFDNMSRIGSDSCNLNQNDLQNSKANNYLLTNHFASDSTEDLYKSIDNLVQKLDRMLRRRSRLNKVRRKDTHLIDIPAQIPKAV